MERKLIRFRQGNSGTLQEGTWHIRFAYYDEKGKYISGESEEANISNEQLYNAIKKYLKKDK